VFDRAVFKIGQVSEFEEAIGSQTEVAVREGQDVLQIPALDDRRRNRIVALAQVATDTIGRGHRELVARDLHGSTTLLRHQGEFVIYGRGDVFE